jgi:SpoVK/Ycf46/Vps4 family AAA+-type ATPase
MKAKNFEFDSGIIEDLELLIKARYTLIQVVTWEEERALNILEQTAKRGESDLYSWDPVRGIKVHVGEERNFKINEKDPEKILEILEDFSRGTIFVMLDMDQYWSRNPGLVRKIKILCAKLKTTRTSLVLLSHENMLPGALSMMATTVEINPPDYREMLNILKKILGKARFDGLSDNLREKVAKVSLGLSAQSAVNVIARAMLKTGDMDERVIPVILDEKRRLIRKSGILEFFESEVTLDSIGGLRNLKDWLGKREKAFSEEAASYGLPAPKGLLLIGVQGTGKSLTAKAVSALWRLPLLRFDVGRVFGSLVGESEERMREAISLAETISPCLLWIDEMDKSFAGLSGGGSHGDSGTSARVFGTLLTWMQEKRKSVFVVATANNVMHMPPELLRKGRFDEVFFIDLPTLEERKDIFRVHLKKVRPVLRSYDLDVLAQKSQGFSGAEIEQSIIEAMFNAFDDNQRDFTTEDILKSLGELIPLSQFMREDVEALRTWAVGRARKAS